MIVMEEMIFLHIHYQFRSIEIILVLYLSFILSDSLLKNNTSGQHIYVSPVDIPGYP